MSDHDPELDDPRWQALAQSVFGRPHTADEGLFVYKVMEDIRRLPRNDQAWPLFIRWAFPVLGAAVATLFLAARTPETSAAVSFENALTLQQAPDEDPLSQILEVTP